MTAVNTPYDQSRQAIEALLQQYFDGLYHCDIAVLGRVFHPSAHYSCACEGELVHWDMPSYFKRVAAREPPARRGQKRQDQVVSIEFAGPQTALATVNCAIADRYFTDFLSLIVHEGQWWIIAKVFHYETTLTTH